MNNWRLLLNQTWVLFDKNNRALAQLVKQGTHNPMWRGESCSGLRFWMHKNENFDLRVLKQVIETHVKLSR